MTAKIKNAHPKPPKENIVVTVLLLGLSVIVVGVLFGVILVHFFDGNEATIGTMIVVPYIIFHFFVFCVIQDRVSGMKKYRMCVNGG